MLKLAEKRLPESLVLPILPGVSRAGGVAAILGIADTPGVGGLLGVWIAEDVPVSAGVPS